MEIDAIASELMEALDRSLLLPPVSERVTGFDVPTGYTVGAWLTERRRARGERTIGRKLGFTNRALWNLLGVDAPFWAYVYDATVTMLGAPSGSAAIGHLAQPRLEPELVLHFASAPPATADDSDLLAFIDWIALAFEIVQCHFPDWVFGTADAIADFGVHGALIVGEPTSIAVLDDPAQRLRDFTIALHRNGVEEARGGGSNVLESPVRALAQVMLRAEYQDGWEPIRAGEIVTTGTLTGLHTVETGDRWRIDVSGIPLAGLWLRIE